jgi:hypothetical protein
VGFQKLLGDGDNFLNRLLGAFSPEHGSSQLVHIAVDGETFGHHHRFGEMALSYAIDKIETDRKIRLTNYGEYLEKNPPSWRVEIWDNSSWSCCHGIERWREDCGCSTGANPGWRQKWRAPLRRALDELRDRLEPLYVNETKNLLNDPWAARNGYIDLILDRFPDSVERFFAIHATRPLDRPERIRALELLEMQRYALLMYTSCGWFFDDIAGIEALQVLQYAGRAIQLAEKLSGESAVETSFLETLGEAESNDPEMGDGRDLYLKFVRPSIIDDSGIAAHYAMRSLFEDFPVRVDFYSRVIDRWDLQVVKRDGAKLIWGSCSVTSKITGESADMDFAAIYPWNAQACLRLKKPERLERSNESEYALQKKIAEMRDAFEKEDDMFKVFRLMNECFSDGCFALKDLVKDEQRKIFDCQIASTTANLELQVRRIFARVTPLLESMLSLGMTPPPRFLTVNAEHFHTQLRDEFLRRPVRPDSVRLLLEAAKRRKVQWRLDTLEPVIRTIIESLAREARQSPLDITARKNLAAAVSAAKYLPFAVDLYGAQNHCYVLLREHYPEIKAAADKGNADAVSLRDEFRILGALLSIVV